MWKKKTLERLSMDLQNLILAGADVWREDVVGVGVVGFGYGRSCGSGAGRGSGNGDGFGHGSGHGSGYGIGRPPPKGFRWTFNAAGETYEE